MSDSEKDSEPTASDDDIEETLPFGEGVGRVVSDDELVAIINRIGDRLMSKFEFSYHTRDDIRQQVAVFTLECLDKYDPARGKFDNLAYVHVKNRLCNFKRKTEKLKPCHNCPLKAYVKNQDLCTAFKSKPECSYYSNWRAKSQARRNVTSPIEFASVDDAQEDSMKYHDFPLLNSEHKEMLEHIEANIPIIYLHDYKRLMGGLKVSQVRRKKIQQLVKKILEEMGGLDVGEVE